MAPRPRRRRHSPPVDEPLNRTSRLILAVIVLELVLFIWATGGLRNLGPTG